MMLAPARTLDVRSRRAAAPRALRVCHVMTADLWAGAEVQLATVASFLARQPDVQLSAVLFNEGRLARELRCLGVEIAVFDERQHNSFAIVRLLQAFLRERAIDLVHTHRYKDTILGAIAAKLSGVPHLVRTVHGLPEPMGPWDGTKFNAYDLLDRTALWCCADRVIAVSKGMAQTLSGSGYRRRAVTHIHNGLDLSTIRTRRSRVDVRRELGIEPAALLIGTAGRLSPVKGHDDFIRAAALVLQEIPSARFLVAGDGPLRDQLTRLAAQLRVERACVFTGPRNDVHDVMGALDVFVLPSLAEGIPMALLEAMALGRPVIATRVGGVPEVVRENETGLLVPPRNARALADACLALADDPARADAIGARATRMVETEFALDRKGQALIELYRDVMRQPDARPARVSSAAPEALTLGLVRCGWDALRCAAMRAWMSRARRNRSALAKALRSARRILIVCHGNIIRSPFAARLLAQALGDGQCVSIVSRGLAARPGRPAHERAVSSASARRVDLRDHRAQPVTPSAVAESDLVFVMDVRQLLDMRRRFPEARRRIFLLTCLAPEVPLEIHDPVDAEEHVFHACYDHIARAVRPLAGALSEGRLAS